MKTETIQKLYDALKRISQYQSPSRIRKSSEAAWGLCDSNEAVDMAYENVLAEAKAAIKGVKRP